MLLINFDNCELSSKQYGGSERKIGIIINGIEYMLKFQKKTAFALRNNTLSEYIGSHVCGLLGLECQETYLGTYKNEYVVACKNFINNDVIFVPFNDVGESSLEIDKNKYKYTYDDIIQLLLKNKKITNVEETISAFFDLYIVDALLGNFDRHGSNWGFLKNNNKYSLAPVFDNGSCLYPSLTNEDEMRLVLENENEINKRVYTFPTSQIKMKNNKSSYYEVISSLQFEEINKALLRIYPRIKINEIDALIDDISIISDTHKLFYKTMIKKRYEKIIKYSYDKLRGKNENI